VSPAGRPEIGQPINVRLGDELLAAVDADAQQQGTSRAETIREILASHYYRQVQQDIERVDELRTR
jgi:metal-responsive CopG/Arc/MetJ family transcriptional regulator